METEENRRVLIIDDNESIHADFRKIIGGSSGRAAVLDYAAEALFGEASPTVQHLGFAIDSAHQGQEGLTRVQQSIEQGRRYALAFVDIRMPPGWDGIETVRRIWDIDNALQVVICTAYSDYSWSEMVKVLGETDRWLILKKPFDNIEVRQIASALVAKWNLAQKADRTMQDLTEMVRERTRELTCTNTLLLQESAERKRSDEALRQRDEQLRQSQKMESLGTLAGGVAHEFNNLLQSMQGYTRLAMDELEPDDPRYQNLEVVLSVSQQAATLTKQLLGFGRRQILQFADFDPNQMVRDLVKLLLPLIGDHIRIDTVLAPNLGTINGDASLLQQLLMNLCVNARDAMPAGGDLLIETDQVVLDDRTCPAYPDLVPGRHLLLTVSDTGCGMAPDVLNRAFEPFFTTKCVGQGTGLGLAMVYGVVRQHKGTIRVESEPGTGTKFEIYLPFANRPAADKCAGHAVTRSGSGEVVLVVEDEESARNLAVWALKAAGYETLIASDGVEALAVFESHRTEISLVLLDVMMPGMNGREVYHRMKQIDKDVKAIFCSACDPHAAQLGFISEHGLPLLRKPFDPASLLQVVREVLDRQRPLAGVAYGCK
jgi:two-component system NtrC family sensor kinase